MNPDEVVRLRGAGDGFRVSHVHLFISLPICRLEIAKILQIVKKRPNHLVGVSVIKFVALAFTQTHRHNLIAGVARGLGKRSLWNFARNPRPADPSSATLAQHWLYSR